MIYLVRHGQTDDNINSIVQGNKGLNKNGKQQAIELAIQLKDIDFDICYCSPLKRTKQTLKYVLKYHKKLKVVMDERLKERDYGKLVGVCTKQIPNYEHARWDANCNFHQSVESVKHIYNRVVSFYKDILPKNKGKNILIVAHSGIARMSHFYFNGKPKDNNYINFKLDNGEIMEIKN